MNITARCNQSSRSTYDEANERAPRRLIRRVSRPQVKPGEEATDAIRQPAAIRRAVFMLNTSRSVFIEDRRIGGEA